MNFIATNKTRNIQAGEPNTGVNDAFRVVAVEDPVTWDSLLESHPLGSAQASAGWGVYKERSGHEVRRLTVVDKTGNILAMALVAMRSRLGIRVSHIAAGPLLFTESPTVATKALETLLDDLATGSRNVVAIEPLLFGSQELTHALLSTGMTPVLSPGQHTLIVDLSIPEETLRKQLKRRWSRNLRKAEANEDLTVRFASTPSERSEVLESFARFYEDLVDRKGFETSFSPEAAKDVFRDDPRYVIIEIRENGEPTAIQIAHRARDILTSFYAASSDTAMKNHSSLLAYWELIKYAREHGLRIHDCGGIDPFRNPGVYNFKTGLTDNIVQTGPIWVHAKSRLLRILAQQMLAQK